MKQKIKAYHKIKTALKFREIEKLRSLVRHNEVVAIRHVLSEDRADEREKWKNVVADKDAEIARLHEQMERKIYLHDEAVIRRTRAEEREKWQNIVADKDAEITRISATKNIEIIRLHEQLENLENKEHLHDSETSGRSVSKITAASEFREMERLRSLARHNEAAALHHARDEERKKWQNVVAGKDAEIAGKEAEIARVVAGKDAEIARLREQLEKKGSSA